MISRPGLAADFAASANRLAVRKSLWFTPASAIMKAGPLAGTDGKIFDSHAGKNLCRSVRQQLHEERMPVIQPAHDTAGLDQSAVDDIEFQLCGDDDGQSEVRPLGHGMSTSTAPTVFLATCPWVTSRCAATWT